MVILEKTDFFRYKNKFCQFPVLTRYFNPTIFYGTVIKFEFYLYWYFYAGWIVGECDVPCRMFGISLSTILNHAEIGQLGVSIRSLIIIKYSFDLSFFLLRQPRMIVLFDKIKGIEIQPFPLLIPILLHFICYKSSSREETWILILRGFCYFFLLFYQFLTRIYKLATFSNKNKWKINYNI